MTQSGSIAGSVTSSRKTRPPRRYRIGDLVQHSGLSRQTIHNYTRWGLIQEVEWTAGGHRLYDERAFDRLSVILEMKRTSTIDQIRSKLNETLAVDGG